MAVNKQIVNDAIEALVAMGHKKGEAQRLVGQAIASPDGQRIATIEDLIKAVYRQPTGQSQTKPSMQAQGSSRYANTFYEYSAGLGGTNAASASGQADLLQIAKAIGPGLTLQEFEALGRQLDDLQAKRGTMTNAQYQAAVWAIPDAFRAQRSNPVHFQPLRDSEGRPIDGVFPPPNERALDGLSNVPSGGLDIEPGAIGAMLGGSGTADAPVSAQQSIVGMLEQTGPPGPPQSATSKALDQAQAAADMIGIIDQTGLTDLGNAGVSITRAFTEPGRAGEHLSNAAISAVSAVPLVGDLAKLLKLGGKGASSAQAAKGVSTKTADAAAGLTGSSGGVDAAAQAALVAMVGGSGGGGIGGGSPPGVGGADGSGGLDPRGVGDDIGDAQRSLDGFGSAIERFLNNTGAAGATLAAVGAVVLRPLAGVVDWLKQIDQASKQMLEDNRRFAMFNGQMAAAYQRLDVDRFLRDQDQAAALAGPASRLAGAQSRSEQAQQDLFQPYAQLAVEFQAARTEVAAMILKLVDSVDFIGSLIEWFQGERRMDNAARNDAERAAQMIDEMLVPPKVGGGAPPPAAVKPPPVFRDRVANPNAMQDRIRGWRF